MKKQIVWLSLFFMILTVFSGCQTETMEGFGRDVQKVGQEIEN